MSKTHYHPRSGDIIRIHTILQKSLQARCSLTSPMDLNSSNFFNFKPTSNNMNKFELSTEPSTSFTIYENAEKKKELFFTFNGRFLNSDMLSTSPTVDIKRIVTPTGSDSSARKSNTFSRAIVKNDNNSESWEDQNLISRLFDVSQPDYFLVPCERESFLNTLLIENVPTTLEILNVSKKIFNCHVCNVSFPELPSCLLHYKQMHNLFKCPLCDKFFQNNYLLKNHLLVHSDRRDFVCSKCNYKFRRKNDLRVHVQNVHTRNKKESEIFHCDNCSYKTKCKQFMRSHVLLHLGINSYMCEVCGIQCENQRKLTKHKDSHNDFRPLFNCDICNRSFTRMQTMIVHRKAQHEENDAYQCHICGRTYSYITSFNYHMKIHRQENQVDCDICNKVFSSKRALINHKKIHNGLKDFICKICGKMYFNKNSLQDHLFIHTGSKPFQCRYCDKSFTMRKKLLNHERIHDNARIVHNCPYCEKSYFSKFKLNVHVIKNHNALQNCNPT